MAARTLRPRHSEEIRTKIQSTQLVNALSNHVFGKNEMSSTQIKAAEILLRKSLPDLTQVSGPGDGGEHTVINSIKEIIVDPKH